ncbi:MAG: hypothetical protein FWG74_07535 [Planctomycetes bacterium]|nr:hypothetical protein [Planctomycetota bacterium]
MKIKKKISYPLLIIVLLMLSGCGLFDGPDGLGLGSGAGAASANRGNFAAVPYSQAAAHNYYLGQLYMSQGRYELAKERFSFALGALGEDDMEMRERVVEQLDAASNIIAASR